MYRWFLPFAVFLLLFVRSRDGRAKTHQNRHSSDTVEATLSGFVNDSASGDGIIGATIRVRALHLGALSNRNGFFSLSVPAERALEFEISSLGYKTVKVTMTLRPGEHRSKSFALAAQSVVGGEVTVQGTEEQREREEPQVSKVTLTPQQMINLPKTGQADLFRILQFLPGVQTSSEISSGLYVRGGSPDENLILLDGAALYDPSHFFGFFSTFNPDIIKSVEFIKGGFPAEYGGRLSSVLNVTDVDGDRNETRGTIDLGLISSGGSLQMPVGTGALVLAARRSYIDVLLNATGLTSSLGLPDYYFYDANAKLTQNPSPNDKVVLSVYGGSDNLNFSANTAVNNIGLAWGNKMVSGEWTHLFSSQLFSNFDLSTSNFAFNFNLGSNAQPLIWTNGITDYTARASIGYLPNPANTIKAGVQATAYHSTLLIQVGNNPPNSNIDRSPAYGAIYVQDEWKPDIGGNSIGGMASGGAAGGPLAVTGGLRIDGMSSNPEIGIDPRISARYIVSPHVTIKGSFGIYHQYLKLATNDLVSLVNIWLPDDTTQPPERCYQYVFGVSTAPFADYTLDIEGYYKDFQNLVEPRPNVRTGSTLEDVFFLGNGTAYGAEFFLQKHVGRLTGWLGYTLAWAWRTFPDINNGVTYPPFYDRRNDIDLVGTYQLNDRWTFGATFTYGTGQAYSQITALEPNYENPANTIPIEGNKNALRLPPYNRLDLSATYSFAFLSDHRNAEFDLDIFNVYNHRNVWISQVDNSTNPATITYVRLLPILPTIGVSVKF